MEDEKNSFLDTLYHNVKLPASFSSAKKLLAAARVERSDITLNDVKQYLSTQPSFTKHGLVPKTYRKSMVIVRAPGVLLSSDLADFSNLKDHNNGFRYLIVFIDCFSRRLWVFPINDKKGETVSKVLDDYLTNNQYNFSSLWVDRGKEYYNSHVEKIAKNTIIKCTV